VLDFIGGCCCADKAGQHSSSNSEGEMEDFQEQAQSSVQQVLGQIVEGPVILYFSCC
jgi:hypothetical protein